MSKVVAATLLGPDPQPYWDYCKQQAKQWTDHHVILKDEKGDAWGNESVYRQRLWDLALEACDSPDDWIFVLDSDFVLTFDPHDLTHGAVHAWRFTLYDLWSPTTYRDDQPFWVAHDAPRFWMFRAGASPQEPNWNPAGIHTGHVPLNFPFTASGIAPSRMSILHLGWLTPELRQRKYDRYHDVWDQLSEFQKAHVESVLDKNPTTYELPEYLRGYLSALPADANPTS